MTEREYPYGIDTVWLASDRNGHVAAFITAGVGPIPSKAIHSDNVTVEDIEEKICELPRLDHSHSLIPHELPVGAVGLVERGLFVYDWTDVNRTARKSIQAYELIARPLHPISIAKLSAKFLTLLSNIKLDGVSFENGELLDVRTQIDCVDGEVM